MPIKIQNDLPVKEILENENLFVVDENRASHQDIRPLQLCILNLMPKKEETELQLLRMLSNTPLQIDITFMRMSSHQSQNTPMSHLQKFYYTFDELRDQRFDGLIITGAPVEKMEYEDVDYWPELCEVFAWSKTNVFSTFHICWGAQAGLYYHYGLKTPTRCGTEKSLLSGDLTIISSFRTAATRRSRPGPFTRAKNCGSWLSRRRQAFFFACPGTEEKCLSWAMRNMTAIRSGMNIQETPRRASARLFRSTIFRATTRPGNRSWNGARTAICFTATGSITMSIS